jgi:PPOX class probable F420-dependent enzyme
MKLPLEGSLGTSGRTRSPDVASALAPLVGAKTILLTTYKRDGTPVSTPVSIAFADGRAFIRSWHRAWKTKRLARDPRVEAARCTLRGEPSGPAISASATLLSGDDARLARRALGRRHPILQAVLVPLTHRLLRYRTMHYELVPSEH